MSQEIDHPNCSFNDIVTAGVKMERQYGKEDLSIVSSQSAGTAAQNGRAANSSGFKQQEAETPGLSDLISRMDRLVVLTENQQEAAQMRPPYAPPGTANFNPGLRGGHNQDSYRHSPRWSNNNRWSPRSAHQMERMYLQPGLPREENGACYTYNPTDQKDPCYEAQFQQYDQSEEHIPWAFLSNATGPESVDTLDFRENPKRGLWDFQESSPAVQISPTKIAIDRGNSRLPRSEGPDNGRFGPRIPTGVTPLGVRPVPIELSSRNRTSNITPSAAQPIPPQESRPTPFVGHHACSPSPLQRTCLYTSQPQSAMEEDHSDTLSTSSIDRHHACSPSPLQRYCLKKSQPESATEENHSNTPKAQLDPGPPANKHHAPEGDPTNPEINRSTLQLPMEHAAQPKTPLITPPLPPEKAGKTLVIPPLPVAEEDTDYADALQPYVHQAITVQTLAHSGSDCTDDIASNCGSPGNSLHGAPETQQKEADTKPAKAVLPDLMEADSVYAGTLNDICLAKLRASIILPIIIHKLEIEEIEAELSPTRQPPYERLTAMGWPPPTLHLDGGRAPARGAKMVTSDVSTSCHANAAEGKEDR